MSLLADVTVGRSNFLGRPIVTLTCGGCPAEVSAMIECQDQVEAEMAIHLELFHADELGCGRCIGCGQWTDNLRIHHAEHGDAWVCETCAPAPSLSELLAGGAEVMQP